MSHNKDIKMLHELTGRPYKECRAMMKAGKWDLSKVIIANDIFNNLADAIVQAFAPVVDAIIETMRPVIETIAETANNIASILEEAKENEQIS